MDNDKSHVRKKQAKNEFMSIAKLIFIFQFTIRGVQIMFRNIVFSGIFFTKDISNITNVIRNSTRINYLLIT